MSEAQQAELRQDVRLKYGTLITDEGTWELMEFAYMSWMNRAARCNDTAPVAPIGDEPAGMKALYQTGFARPENTWGDVDKDVYDTYTEFGYARRRIIYVLAAVAAPISDAQIEAGVEAWFSTYGNDFHARMRSALAAVAAQGESSGT